LPKARKAPRPLARVETRLRLSRLEPFIAASRAPEAAE